MRLRRARKASRKTPLRLRRSIRRRASSKPAGIRNLPIEAFRARVDAALRGGDRSGNNETLALRIGNGGFAVLRAARQDLRRKRYLDGHDDSASRRMPAFDRWNLSLASPLNRRWSTSLPRGRKRFVTVATLRDGRAAHGNRAGNFGFVRRVVRRHRHHIQRDELSGAARAARARQPPRMLLHQRCGKQCGRTQYDLFQPIEHGIFQRRAGVHARDHGERAGVSVGSSGPAAFAGQILDADTLFRNDGQATFATPAALATRAGRVRSRVPTDA